MINRGYDIISKGAYSSIVYIDGSMYVADDFEGNLIQEGTDAATIIQAAVNKGGKTLIVGTGFTISDTITLKDNSVIDGMGSWNTQLTAIATLDKPIFKIEGVVGNKVESVLIRDIVLYGNDPVTNTSQYGIKMKYSINVMLDKVWFYNLYDGVHAETYHYNTWANECVFDTSIENNALHLHAAGDWDACLILLDNCFVTSKGNNIDYTHAMGLKIVNGYFESTSGHNIYGARSYGMEITGTDFDGNGAAKDVINEATYATEFRINSGWMTGEKRGIMLADFYGGSITGTSFKTKGTGIWLNQGDSMTITGITAQDCGYLPAATYSCIKVGNAANANDIIITGCILGHPDNTFSIDEKAGNLENLVVGNRLKKAGNFAAGTEAAHNT